MPDSRWTDVNDVLFVKIRARPRTLSLHSVGHSQAYDIEVTNDSTENDVYISVIHSITTPNACLCFDDPPNPTNPANVTVTSPRIKLERSYRLDLRRKTFPGVVVRHKRPYPVTPDTIEVTSLFGYTGSLADPQYDGPSASIGCHTP
jgi:hypothetical protein